MSEFKPGDIVDITIEGARVRAIRGEDIVDHLSYETQGGFVASVALTESVTVERVAPAEWPPRPGDLWRTERQPYFVVDFGDRVAMTNLAGEHFQPDFILAHGGLTLVHREDERDGGAS